MDMGRDDWNGMILYEDSEILVCHKPEGMAVQSARLGQKDLVSILNNYLAEGRQMEAREADGQTEKCRDELFGKHSGERYGKYSGEMSGKQKRRRETVQTVSVVHRLDQPVEGVIVFAKTKRAAAGLTRQITDGRMRKVYQAVCCVTEKAEITDDPQKVWVLTDYLVKDGRTNTSRIAAKGEKDAKEARLSFRVLKSWKVEEEKTGSFKSIENLEKEEAAEREKKVPAVRYVLAEINLETGRHHQIRVQMAHAGLPLYGDRKYNPDWERYLNGCGQELALCAVSLDFAHPVTGKKLHFAVKPQKKIFQEQ